MGGAVSAGEDNDELIDNLVNAEYIKTYPVENTFRAVDRGDYFLEECRENAYRDLAWKNGNIHISAPCIYSEVLESLKLGPGMSFLNLGSGTGYLSTMAGLILGPYGINHGIELHQSNIDYAKEKLEEFQNCSPALDKYEFCPPSFVLGNCLLLDTSYPQYDRVYCGASCPSEHENFLKSLVRVGGVLVMPLNDNLLQIIKTTETTFDVRNVLPVSFASLVVPTSEDSQLPPIKLPEKNPLLLQEICRSAVRVILRKTVEQENPSLTVKRVIKRKRKKGKRQFRRIVIPFMEENRVVGPVPDRREELQVSDQEDEALDMEAEAPNIDHIIDLPGGHQASVIFQNQDNQIFVNVRYENCSDPESCNQDHAEVVIDDSNNNDLNTEMEQEEILENNESSEAPKGGRRRTLTANGDSGIDNISDDSLPEEYPSDCEKTNEDGPCLPTAQNSSEDMPSNSSYFKRSAEENREGSSPELQIDQRSRHRHPHCRGSMIFKRVAFSGPDSDELEEIDSDSDNEKFPKYDEKNYLFRYSYFMKQKINQLPIPHTLKVYLNLSRPV